MAKRKPKQQKRGDEAGVAANGASPPKPAGFVPTRQAPEASRRPRNASPPGVIFTPEGMIEERDWREPRMREKRPEEKSIQELVASVMARPPVEEPAAEDAAAGQEAPAEGEWTEAPGDAPAKTAEDSEAASRRRMRVLAVLSPVAFILAAGAILFSSAEGGSDAVPDPGAAQPADVTVAPAEGGAPPPADSQVAAQPPAPEPAPAVVPVETPAPAPPPPEPVITAAPPPPPPPPPPPTAAPPPPPPPPPTEIHIGDLDGATPGQKVAVRISVHDAAHNPVSGVTVTGQWGGAYSGTATCVTDSIGTCAVRTQNLSAPGSVTFTVSTLALGGAVYAGATNHDEDGDSSGTSITIAVAA